MKKEIRNRSYGGATASADMVRVLFTIWNTGKSIPQWLKDWRCLDRFQMEPRIPASKVNRLWEVAQKASDDPDFGLQ